MNQVAESLDVGGTPGSNCWWSAGLHPEQTGVLDAQLHSVELMEVRSEGEDLAFHVDRHGLIVTQ